MAGKDLGSWLATALKDRTSVRPPSSAAVTAQFRTARPVAVTVLREGGFRIACAASRFTE